MQSKKRPEKGKWEKGWKEIGGKRHYFKSKWESNYCRYLEFLKKHGEIVEWEYEPVTFWFENIKRGVRSYLPDFRITNKDSSTEFHEVKGWLDPRSKTKVNRMRIYYPEVKLRIIDGGWFNSQNRKLKAIVPEWE
jgi:hypothetical protein